MTVNAVCQKKIVLGSIAEAEKLGWKIDSNHYPKTLSTVKKVMCPECVAKEKERDFVSIE